MKIKLKILSLSVMIALAGCSSDTEDTGGDTGGGVTPNKPQVLIVGEKNISVNEGGTQEISYTLTDQENDFATIKTTVSLSNNIGSVSIDENSRKINYVAPTSIAKDLQEIVTITSIDSKNKHTVKETVNLSVINIGNSAPEITLASSSFIVEELSTLNIPFDVTDKDGDKVNVSINVVDTSNVLTKAPTINSNSLDLSFGEITTDTADITIELSATDGEDVVSKSIKIKVQNKVGDSIPNIDIFSGTESLTIKESSNLVEIPYTISKAKDNPNSTLDVSYSLYPSDLNINVVLDKVSKKLILKDFVFIGDKEGRLEMTVSDGLNSFTDQIHLVFVDDVDHQLNSLLELYNPVNDMYNSLSSRNDELKIFDFYKELSLIKYPKNDSKMALLRLDLLNNIQNEKNEIQILIDDLNSYISDSNRDITQFNKKMETFAILKDKVNKYGSSAIIKINEANRNNINNLLPVLIADNVIVTTVNDVNYYSRYVGNQTYGSFDLTKSSWSFKDDFKFMELVNILNTYCK